MLGKLLKYEFKLTARTLLPIYAALAGLTVLMCLTTKTPAEMLFLFQGTIGELLLVAIYSAYGIMMSAVFIITVVLLIERFYKNLLRDEGYLMHTLPVTTGGLVFSKLAGAVVWSVISIVIGCLSVMLVAMDAHDWAKLFQEIGEAIVIFNRELGFHWVFYVLELLVLLLLMLGNAILHVYTAVTLGHIANRRKVLWSVAAYVGIASAMTFVTALLGSWNWLEHVINRLLWGHFGGQFMSAHIVMIFLIGFYFVKCAIFFGVTNWLMKHRLNLE